MIVYLASPHTFLRFGGGMADIAFKEKHMIRYLAGGGIRKPQECMEGYAGKYSRRIHKGVKG